LQCALVRLQGLAIRHWQGRRQENFRGGANEKKDRKIAILSLREVGGQKHRK